ncbi:cytochrome c oxidase accessory protein CcoG [Sphingomonas sp. NSE70-1]|uniref:Cytochrome c oxidase accessory protein CcoG n=1 Tax=Sphingomonas caseinilyticus TaxID=2908205 RepID=A0ABT0RVI9_9SPHN|nr:cytochrome c oxidase accessory protein CcoG [Sphingomonas caseinilyticus]MCL6699007.1 cytochrome c oxidase accessory protein CcoG [Sphingomonas caseinilyticus]
MNEVSTTGPKSLYEKRQPVYPQKIDGHFRRLKWAIMAVTLAIYYVTPWLRWDRGPYAPDQAVLIDLASRRFYFGPIEIWPHEFYYVAGLLIMAGIGLFLVTSAVGRAWCGYACPQTVWTDVFQHIERAVEGDRNAQVRLAAAPWSVEKIGKRSLKYSLFLLVSLATGGAWIFYFADAPTLLRQFIAGEASLVAYSTVAILMATTFVFGGFMREQVCIYMCPWPRIQTAMMDEKSLLVTYKDWRGEPRGKGRRTGELSDLGLGDCIDCNQCVAVCPTGIDIRNGPQIGCITCALCIDACDRVMEKTGRPRGLIDYATLEDCAVEKSGGPPKPLLKSILRPRTIAYALIWSSVGLGMLFALGNRTRLDISAQQQRNPVYVQLSDGGVRNSYTIKLRNMQTRPREMRVDLTNLPGASMWRDGQTRDQASRSIQVVVPPDALAKLPMFVVAPGSGDASEKFGFTVRSTDGEGEMDSTEAIFERPRK